MRADALSALAREWSYTPAQLALAWLLDQGQGIVPIPGTRCPAAQMAALNAWGRSP